MGVRKEKKTTTLPVPIDGCGLIFKKFEFLGPDGTIDTHNLVGSFHNDDFNPRSQHRTPTIIG